MNSQAATMQIRPDNLRFLREYIHRESGILLDETKGYLIETRLFPVIRRAKLADFDALCMCLRADRDEQLRRQIVESMATHETLFFRDGAPFDALQHTLLPRLIEQRKGTRRLSFWSAASSSGQEAYSLAMLLLEAGLADWNLQVLATDISQAILDRAQEGMFSQLEVSRGLPAHFLVKYFDREGANYRLSARVRSMVRFEKFDLRDAMHAKGPFDMVFCRNVLIYFDVPTKKKILREIRSTLFPGGHLVLGGSETTLGLDDAFTRVTQGRAVLYQAP